MHHMIFSIACRSTVWSWLEGDQCRPGALPLAARCHAGSRQSGHRERAQADSPRYRRSRPHRSELLVSKHLHMMFRNQTEVLDQFPEYFETSRTPLTRQKGQVYFGRFYLGKCNKASSVLMRSGP